MGYLSDVKLITTKEGWERIKKEISRVGAEEEYSLISGVGDPICDGKYVLAEWDDVKWYEGHNEEVDAIMRELGRFDAEHIPYQYLRVGEDWEDYERLSEECYDNPEYDDMPYLTLKREIEVEY